MPKFEWGGAFEGWARGWVSRNFWRVRELLGSEDDALQECAVVFVRCKNRYEGKIDNPAWMMSLFKQAVANEWHTLSKRDGQHRSIPIATEIEQVDYNPGMLAAAIAGSSAELREVIRVIANAPTEFLGLLFGHTEGLHALDPKVAAEASANMNRRIKRLLRISNPAADVVSELRALLS